MRKPHLSIEVHGQVGTGKSSIAEVIRQALVAHGLTVQVNDYEGIPPLHEQSGVPDIQKTMPVLAEKLDTVSITCIQSPRVRYIEEGGLSR